MQASQTIGGIDITTYNLNVTANNKVLATSIESTINSGLNANRRRLLIDTLIVPKIGSPGYPKCTVNSVSSKRTRIRGRRGLHAARSDVSNDVSADYTVVIQNSAAAGFSDANDIYNATKTALTTAVTSGALTSTITTTAATVPGADACTTAVADTVPATINVSPTAEPSMAPSAAPSSEPSSFTRSSLQPSTTPWALVTSAASFAKRYGHTSFVNT